MTLVGYVRHSPEHKGRADRVTCEVQADRIRSWCAALDLKLGEIIEDRDESGKDQNRPGWARVLQLLDEGDASGVVVYKLDRMTRSLRDLLDLMAGPFARRELHSVSERIDTTTATGRMIVHLLGMLAQWERETIGERTSGVLRHKIKQGLYIGGVPYGWRRVTGPDGKLTALERVEIEQEAIREAISMDRSGVRQDRIAEELTRKGYPSRSGRPWSRRGVQCILSQPEQ